MLEATQAVDAPSVAGESRFLSAPDGLMLHVRCYEPKRASGWPVVCLPGLARTEADFETLAAHLALDEHHARRVYALDYRGRGRSDHDPDWRNYNLPTELADVIAVLTALEVHKAVFVGTSRGGMLTMLLAAARPTLIGDALLNDIGPVIEPQGLMRIKGYVGKLPQPKDLADGAVILRRVFSAQFPRLSDEDWLTWAGRTWQPSPAGLRPRYDPKLANTLIGLDLEKPLPPLWNQFDALANVPVMAVRGMNSDILSIKTLEAMRSRRASMSVLEVAEQGHAPLLAEPVVLAQIARFVLQCEETNAGRIAASSISNGPTPTFRRRETSAMPSTAHNPLSLPDNLPAPDDDGAARHLAKFKVPDIPLPATDGPDISLARLQGRTVVYAYPRTGEPGKNPPDGWDAIPGARGCTPQSCGFRDHFAELKRIGVGQVFGLSSQDTDYQREAAQRLHLPFPLLSDQGLKLARAMKLPTFEVAGMTLLKRLALVIDDGVVSKVFYPVFPPDKSAEDVIAWIQAERR